MARKKTDPDEQLEQEIGNAFVDAGIMEPTADMPGNDSVIAEATPDAADAKPETKDESQSKYVGRVLKANQRLHRFQSKVAQAEAEVEQAKGILKKAIGDRDGAVVELQKVIEGQQQLPGMEDDHEATETSVVQMGTADNWPISELGAKQLGKLLGETLMTASKGRDEPLGLTGPQLEKFESEGVTTIGDLEKRMTDKPHDWWSFLAKKADAAIVNRVLNSWREFRTKCPVQERTPTVLEKLAAQNAEPMPADLTGTLAGLGASA